MKSLSSTFLLRAVLLVSLVANSSLAEEPPVDGPLDMLRIMQIDDSQLRFIQDDRPVADEEQETILQLLYRLPTFSQVDVEAWTQPIVDWQSLVDDPASARFSMFNLQGRVVSLRTREVLPELVSRLRFRQYFDVQIKVEGGYRAQVLVRNIPRVWRQRLAAGGGVAGANIAGDDVAAVGINGQSIRVAALLLKRDQLAKQPGLVFAAARVGWHPTEPNAELQVSDDQVLLGQLGVDISRLEEVQQKRSITGEDRECFYQMLAAVRHAEPQQLARLGRTEFDIAQLLQRPSEVSGQLYTLAGRARRAVLIHVEDEDIQQRFGLNHYYEIEVFLPLQRNVRFVEKGNAEGKLFTDYPFVICVPDLPPGMAIGDDIRVPISFSGFFLKLWAYRSEFMSSGRDRGEPAPLQLSPLLIGPSVVPDPGLPPSKTWLGIGLAIGFVGCLAAIWLILWRVSIDDRRFAKTKLYEKLRVNPETWRSIEEP